MNTLKDGSYRWVLWCVVVLGVSRVALMPQHGESVSTGSEWVDALWVAKDNGLLKMDVSDASPLLEIADIGDVRAMDIDDRRGLMWAFSKDRLRGMTFGGEVRFTVPEHFKDRKNHDRDNDDDDDDDDDADDDDDDERDDFKLQGDRPFGLQVNSNTGTVWLGLERLLHQFDSEANRVRTLSLPDKGQALALDELTSYLWVATRGALLCYDETGSLIQLIELGRKVRVEDIDIDPDSGGIWVVGRNGLSRLDTTGQLVFETRTKKLTQVVTDHRGGAWLAGDKTLIHINPLGEPFFELKPFGKKGKELLALAADPLDGSVWAASKEQVAHVSAAGKILQSSESKGFKRKKGHIRDLGLYVDVIAPEIAFTAPHQGILTNNNRLSVMLNFTDIGEGVDPSTVDFEINGEEWFFDCVVDDEREGATCVPIMALPEGVIELLATVQDLNGNRSDPDSLVFTVDKTAPLITLISPPDDLLTNQPQQTIVGQISEPARLSINGKAVSLTENHQFAQPLTLEEGTHLFVLVATDQAGNEGTLVIRVTLDTVPPSAADTHRISVVDLGGGLVSIDGTKSSVEPGALVRITNADNGETLSVIVEREGAFSAQIKAQPGQVLSIVVIDGAGNGSRPVEVFLSQPLPPLLGPIGDQTVKLGSSLKLQLMASDPNGDSLTFAASPLPLLVNMELDAVTGLFTFTPDEDQVEILDLTFIVSDGAFTNSQTITISVLGSDPNGLTALTGRVLDTNDFVQGVETPVVGVTISLLATGFSTTSDADGNFNLEGTPSGSQILDIDSSTAGLAPDGSPYSGFREEIELIKGVSNVVDRPFFLPRIEQESLTLVDPFRDTVVENPRLGVVIEIPRFTAKLQDGSLFAGALSISEVPDGLAPAALPEELTPGLLITIQPVGVIFETPVPITFPNVDNLPGGSEVDIWSLDPDTGSFIIVGRGRVSDDGVVIETISGGIYAADWHLLLPQAPPVSPAAASSENNSNNQDQSKCTDCPGGSRTAVSSGNLRVEHTLASYRSSGQSRELQLIYNSFRANPQPVISANASIAARTAVPATLASRLSVAGVDQAVEVFTDTSGLSPGVEVRQAVQFDASSFQTGIYPYRLTLSGNYTRSSISSVLSGRVLINNQQKSSLGAGWTLEGVGRLVKQNQDILLTEGDGSVRLFTAANGGTGTFSGLTNFGVGSGPASVAVADFNGDQILDLAVATNLNVSILLGDGVGSFSGPGLFPAGSLPRSVAAGDFNGDTRLDLAVANFLSDNVSILLGNGRGAFSRPTDFRVGDGPVSVVIGDFNGDAILDLVSGSSNHVSVLLGDGTGTFSGPTHLSAGSVPRAVAVGNFNGDAIPDLAVANLQSGNVSILLGDGRGTFSDPTDFRVETRPVSVAVGDFNGDAVLDLAVSNFLNNNVSILLGDGTGGFSDRTNFAVGNGPGEVAVGDFNGDTLSDLVVTNGKSDSVSILLGDGTDLFLDPANFAVGDQPEGLGIGDFDGDTVVDLAVVNIRSNNVSILHGVPGGLTGFQSPPGDYSILVENGDGTFTRTLKDGTQISFSAEGLQTSVVDRNGNTTRFTYDADERLITITDPVGLETTFSYVEALLGSIGDPAGRVTQFEHDAAGNMTRISDPDGTSRSFEYDSRHRLIAQISKRGFRTSYAYDFAGRNVGVRRSDGSTRGIVSSGTVGLRDPASGVGRPEKPAPVVSPGDAESLFIDGNGSATHFITNRFGATTATTDALGRQTLIERDVNSNPMRIIKPNGSVTTMTYDERGNLLTSTKQAIDATTSFTYEPVFNQVISVTDPEGNVTTINYNVGGNPIEVIDAQGTGTVMTYEDLNCPGQLTSVTAALGLAEENTTRFEYDAATCKLLRAVDPLLNVTILAYDSAGNVIESTDAEGRLTRFAYDALNRLTKVIDATHSSPNPLCGTAGVTCYDYDNAGNLTQVTDARDSVTTFEYDSQDRLIQTIDPLGRSETFAYDDNGNLISTTDRSDQTIEFQYDAVNQLIQKTVLPGMPDESITRFGYDSVGNLASVVDPDSSLTMTYDQLGRLGSISTTGSPNQPDVTLNYTYDKDDKRLSITGPTGQTEYVYDELSRLTHLTNPSVQTVTFDYDALGRRTQMNMPNGVTTSYTYDAASRLLNLVHQLGANTINSFAYTYDNVGNRTSRTDNNGTAEFTYDELNRLAEAINPLPSNPLEAFTYDEVGNRVDSNQNGLSIFNSGNQLTGDVTFTYTYDANGNQIQKTNRATGLSMQFEYDAENRLIRLAREDGNIMSYRYDGLGRRIEKDIAGVLTRYIYDNEDILLELDGSDNILARYTHGPGSDEPLIMERDLNSSGTFEASERFFYHTDGLGSVTELTGTSGAVAQYYVYSPFGQIEFQLDPTLVQPYTFTSREFDLESGLHFYRARTYEAITGRFLQMDPIGFAGGINLYTYAGNNPMNIVDPFGLAGFKDAFKNPKVKAIGGAAVGFLITKLTEKLCPGPARGLVNLAGFAVALHAGVAATALSVGSAVAAFGSVPTGVGPVAGILGTVGFGTLAIQQGVTARHFLDQALEDFRSGGKDCEFVCSEARSQ